MEKYMTVKEVADMVRLADQTIRRYVMFKQIPFHKIIRAVRFKRCEIEKWVEEREAKKGAKRKADNSGLFDETEGEV